MVARGKAYPLDWGEDGVSAVEGRFCEGWSRSSCPDDDFPEVREGRLYVLRANKSLIWENLESEDDDPDDENFESGLCLDFSDFTKSWRKDARHETRTADGAMTSISQGTED